VRCVAAERDLVGEDVRAVRGAGRASEHAQHRQGVEVAPLVGGHPQATAHLDAHQRRPDGVLDRQSEPEVGRHRQHPDQLGDPAHAPTLSHHCQRRRRG
jgi:hypothetical protein